jgi:hypothetical protein
MNTIPLSKPSSPSLLATDAVGILFAAAMIILSSFMIMTSEHQKQQAFAQQTVVTKSDSILKKQAITNIPVNIPLQMAYEDGNEIYFIRTDVSDEKLAAAATNQTGFKVSYAPALAQTPKSARTQAYAFTNGIVGYGPFGFQVPVINAKPGDEGYSPLWQVNLVTWKDNTSARELRSVKDIMAAQQNGELSINNTNIVTNHPIVR